MLPTSKAIRAPMCSRCRVSVLRAFTSLVDSSKASLLPPRPRKPAATRIYKRARTFSTPVDHQSEVTSDETAAVKEKESEDNTWESTELGTQETETQPWYLQAETASTEKAEATPDEATPEDQEKESENVTSQATELEAKETETLPWYLQVEKTTPKKPPPEFLIERQRIPDLPEEPPKLLQPLLQQLSVDLGLDYLKILDLRKLEPPPALGANLLMILGTARSENHLHTSADRLCRWLRTTYKLRPDADGLLGRDERKLKERRKARKAKLLGSSMKDNGDDGLHTGWICVDIGVVERAAEKPEATKDFIGFGQRTDGIKLVVQMLTEEKREEIDLEGLWNGRLRHGGRHRELSDDVIVKEKDPRSVEADSIDTDDDVPPAGDQGPAESGGLVRWRSMA